MDSVNDKKPSRINFLPGLLFRSDKRLVPRAASHSTASGNLVKRDPAGGQTGSGGLVGSLSATGSR